jgi:copper chaperone CopZ
MHRDKKYIWTSILTAIGASLCCITPLLALISGASGMASAFSWLEPLRPYLIGITVLVLVFAWYQKLKPKNEIECDCESDEKPKFVQTKTFLGLVTGFAILMLAFPYYGSMFYPKTEKEIIVVSKENIQKVNIDINGMTCNSCEEHVNHTVNKLDGILNVESSYENGSSGIEFDKSKTNIEEIEKAINSTGYTVTRIKIEIK